MSVTAATMRGSGVPVSAPGSPGVVALAPWSEWSPTDYLRDYYIVVEPDEIATIRFVSDAIRRLRRPEPILVFGCGPTLHHVFPVAPFASEIHLADLLPRNLAEIRAWVERREPFHDWRPFVRYALECEGVASPSDAQVALREAMVRSKITRWFEADAADRDPLGAEHRGAYGAVVSCYCADSATTSKTIWRRYMTNICSTIGSGGLFVTAALRTAERYKVGDKFFPSAGIDEADLAAFLERELGERVEVDVRLTPEHEPLGYTGVVLGQAVKRAKSRRR